MASEVVAMPMVGKLISIDVKEGDKVAADQQLAIFESMKMEMPLFAPVSGVVKNVPTQSGKVLEAGAEFCTIEY